MSTISADLLQNRLGTKNPSVRGATFVTAWCTWNVPGGVPTITSTFGVTTITDVSLGQAYNNLTLSHTSFSVSYACWATGTWNAHGTGARGVAGNRAETYHAESNAPTDPPDNNTIIAGVLT